MNYTLHNDSVTKIRRIQLRLHISMKRMVTGISSMKNQINLMVGECRLHGRDVKCVKRFSLKTVKEETTYDTRA